MVCYELTYQNRVHKVCVRLRLLGWTTDEVEVLTENALYESVIALEGWERYVDDKSKGKL